MLGGVPRAESWVAEGQGWGKDANRAVSRSAFALVVVVGACLPY